MKKFVFIGFLSCLSLNVSAATTIAEGVVKKSEVITTQVGSNGKPLLGAAVGVGVGSAFGSGSGKDAAKITGALLGARAARKAKKQTLYGWRYIVEAKGELEVVDAWCAQPNQQCSGIMKDKNVYIVNNNELVVKQ